MSTVAERMKAIADQLRTLSGRTDTLTLAEMATVTTEANTAIEEQETLITALFEAINDRDRTAEFIEKSYSTVNTGELTEVYDYQFYNAAALEAAILPNVVTIGEFGFERVACLVEVQAPKVESLDRYAFYNCTGLLQISLPNLTTTDFGAFYGCTALTAADLPQVTSLGSSCFFGCTKLEKLILRNEEMCSLGDSALAKTKIAGGTGYIYVPSALVDTYKAGTNWSTYADQIRAIEDYPEEAGGTTE